MRAGQAAGRAGDSAAKTARPGLTGGEWAVVLLLAAINFTHILDFVIVMPLGARVMRTLHIDAQQFGFVVSAYGIAATCSGVLASFFADRFDRRTLLLTSYGGFTVATLLCGLTENDWLLTTAQPLFSPFGLQTHQIGYPLLVAARLLAGLFGGVAGSAVMTVIGDLIPDMKRGKAIGVVTSSFAVSSIVGLPIGLFVAKAFDSFGAPFVAIAAASVVVWVVVWFRLPPVRKHLAGERNSPLAQFALVVRQPNHLFSFAFMFALVLGTFIVVPYIAPHLQINCRLPEDQVPWVYAAAGVCTLVGTNVVGWLSDRFNRRVVFLVTAVGAMVMIVVVTHLNSASFVVAAAAASVFMVFASGRIIPAQAMMLASADPKARGGFTVLNAAVSHFATAIGPTLAGWVMTTQSVLDENGQEKIVRLDHYDRAGYVALAFAAAAVGLSFLLRAAPVPKPVTEAAPANPFPLALDPDPLAESMPV